VPVSPCGAIKGANYLSFGATYARIYDFLYQEKNYEVEAKFALSQFRTVVPQGANRILDLGCGTGLHAVMIAQAEISVTGVDRSADMVAVAEKRKETLSKELRERLQFIIGDIRTIDLHRRYDAVFSLFHVMSYQIEDEDLTAAIQTARRHLNAGGVFIFDFWYGPTILREPPQPSVRSILVDETHIQRRTIPEWDQDRHIVCVNYDIEIRDITSGTATREREQHYVRYFFPSELESKLRAFGFEVVRFGEWLTGEVPSDSTFCAYVLARAR
jgi:SAM-dependent methyltransferase